jgi:hypothetical protein
MALATLVGVEPAPDGAVTVAIGVDVPVAIVTVEDVAASVVVVPQADKKMSMRPSVNVYA